MPSHRVRLPMMLIACVSLSTSSCGGSDSSGSNAGTGGADAGSDSSSGGSSAGGGTGSGGTSGSGGSSTGGASASGGATGTGGGAGDAAACPDVYGTYGTLSAIGQGCGDIVTSAPQCIEGSAVYCALHFVSVPEAGNGAVNGGAQLQADGTFSGASIYLGTIQRTGCVGAWNESTSTMEVTCGGTGTSQSCTVTMTRTSSTVTCP